MSNQKLIVSIAKDEEYTSLDSFYVACEGMLEECVEIAEQVESIMQSEHSDEVAHHQNQLISEMCDTMAYFYQIAEQFGVDLDQQFKSVCEGNRNRNRIHRRMH